MGIGTVAAAIPTIRVTRRPLGGDEGVRTAAVTINSSGINQPTEDQQLDRERGGRLVRRKHKRAGEQRADNEDDTFAGPTGKPAHRQEGGEFR
jgi:hypothetical protein